MNLVEAMRSDAAKLLEEKRVKLVLGYRVRNDRRIPALATRAADCESLVHDSQCLQNLASYFRKPEVRRFFPVAVVARPAVMRSLVLLQAESQIPADQVLVLGIDDNTYHGIMDLAATAALLRKEYATIPPSAELLERVHQIQAMSPVQRAEFWSREFAKCTRCYACRAACPNCYCAWCVVKKNTPQWISTAALSHGNYAWNIIRAFHQAGRCTLCGACENACPQEVPLMLLNLWVEQQAREEFDYRPGYDAQAKPLIGTCDTKDSDEFVG